MHSIKLISSEEGDWERLVIDDIIVYENHSISAFELLDILQEKGILKFSHERRDEDYF